MNIGKENEIKILEAAFSKNIFSRAQLSTITGINKVTMSDIVKKYLDINLLSELGSGEPSIQGGRRPLNLTFNSLYGFFVCIDLDKDNYSYIFTDCTCKPILYVKKYINDISLVDLNSIALEVLEKSTDFHSKYDKGLLAITLSLHGIVNNNEILLAKAYNISKLNEVFNNNFKEIPVYIENEANLSAIADLAFTKNLSSSVTISIHSGVGAGIIIEKKLFKGNIGVAGEIGRMTFYDESTKKEVKIGDLISQKSLIDKFNKMTDYPISTPEEFIELYKNRNSTAVNLIEYMKYQLLKLIETVYYFYDPQIIFINSKFVNEIPNFIKDLKNMFYTNIHTSFPLKETVKIKNSITPDISSLIGGSILCAKYFFNFNNIPVFNNPPLLEDYYKNI